MSLNEHMASSYIASALACQICTQQPLQTVTGDSKAKNGQKSPRRSHKMGNNRTACGARIWLQTYIGVQYFK